MRVNILTLLFFFGIVFACKNNSENPSPVNVNAKSISLLDTLTLRLNQGEKWFANNATHIGITNMDSLINVFEIDSSNNYLPLGEALSNQTSSIIKSCDMTGEAHDQLHVVLVPMLDEISILKESMKKEESKNAIYELKALIEAYFNHFKI